MNTKHFPIWRRNGIGEEDDRRKLEKESKKVGAIRKNKYQFFKYDSF